MSEPVENIPSKHIASALKRHGVEYIFGQSCPTLIVMMSERKGIKQIGYRQENTGTYMADGYARVSKKVPVVIAQNGPAASLLVPGLAECLSASIPMVALVQDMDRSHVDKNASQELDQMALFQGVAKWIRRVPRADRIIDYVDQAFSAAASGRPGPAVLLCPMDIVNDINSIALPDRSMSYGQYPLDRQMADPGNIERAAMLLAEADRPLIYAGGGVISSDAQLALRELQEVAHLPVATTSMGKGAVDETHPLSVGVGGHFMGARGMTAHARHLFEHADVVLLVGNRTNQFGTDTWTMFSEDTKFIHLDVDPYEVGRNYESLRLVGDAKSTLSALNARIRDQDLGKRESSRSKVELDIASAKTAHLEEISEVCTSDSSPLRPERIMVDAQTLFEDDQIIVADASFSSIWIANYMQATKERKFIAPRGQAGLGWGFPMAMGARLADPDREVFCVVGDGGFGHAWAEIETAVRHNIKVVVAVLNNSVLGYQLHGENSAIGAHTDACEYKPVDHAAIARACGAKGIRVESVDQVIPALEEAKASDTVTVIDFIVDPDAVPPIKTFQNLEAY